MDLAVSIKVSRASCNCRNSEPSGKLMGLPGTKLGKGKFRASNVSSMIVAWVATCAAKSLSKPIFSRFFDVYC